MRNGVLNSATNEKEKNFLEILARAPHIVQRFLLVDQGPQEPPANLRRSARLYARLTADDYLEKAQAVDNEPSFYLMYVCLLCLDELYAHPCATVLVRTGTLGDLDSRS